MKSLFLLCCSVLAIACADNGGGGDDIGPTEDCLSDSCVCPGGATSCDHACAPGGPPCHVECSTANACGVTCDPNEECHVEASQSARVDVDCRNTFECHVTCPASGCTVTNCIGPECVVTCGLFGGATHNGSTATCP